MQKHLVKISLLALLLNTFWLQASDKPNVLFIAVDDLNDWVGCIGGHPQALTPNIDRLADRGMLFTNAHCQSPVCNPSRASLMTSLYPSTSGIYFLDPDLQESDISSKSKLLPARFQEEGYYVTGVGKLFHGNQNDKYWPNWGGGFGGAGPRPKKKLTSFPGHPLWDWGVYPESDELMPDYQVANWAIDKLDELKQEPLFLGVGFVRPHVPQYAPQKWFDLFPLDKVQLPETIPGDLDDLPEYAIDITRLEHIAPTHEWVLEHDEWKKMVQSYLACVAFVDAQIGKVVDAYDNSTFADNTYIVLFTDHGFHIGEKERHAKRSLWEDSTRTPMIIVGPGIRAGQVCRKPVGLIDIYPTLLDLANLKADTSHEGNSLVPLLRNPAAEWPHYTRTSFGPGNYAIISEQYRYIQYNDGSEEFYDHSKDPNEWHNVVRNPEYATLVSQHRKQVPQQRHAILGEGSTGHNSYAATEAKRK